VYLKETGMTQPEAWQLGALEALRDIGADRVAQGHLWSACRARIADVEPEIGAFVRVNETASWREMGPLAGIPVGIKDIVETIDMPTEFGSPIYKDYQPPRDAYVVAALRRAGAVIAGKTETCEFAGPAPARTRNPHQLSASPGGSSAGSVASVASGMLPLAIGTQTAGSVIRPAAFCGIVGFKPSFGRIDTTGIRPAGVSLDTVGTFARCVADAAWLADILQGRAPAKPLVPASGSLRIGLWHPAEIDQASPSVLSAFDMAAKRISKAGHIIVPVVLPPSFHHAEAAARVILQAETARSTASELLHSPDLVSAGLQAVCEAGATLSVEALWNAQDTIATARQEFAIALGDAGLDAIMTPAAADEAPADRSWTGDAAFNRIWSAIGAPAITLPQCLGARALPIGLQLVAPFGQDDRLLAIAGHLESQIADSPNQRPKASLR